MNVNQLTKVLILAGSLSINLNLAVAESQDSQAQPNIPPTLSSQIDLDKVIQNATEKVVSAIESTKGQVAVMDFPSLEGTTTGLSAYISNRTGNKLIMVGRQVVDRSTLEKVISEQKLQQNALMDAGTAARVGKLAGAGVFIIGNYTLMSTKFVLTVRALSVEKGQFIPGAVAEEIVRPVPPDMSAEIAELVKKRAVASNISLDDNQVEISDSETAGTPSAAEITFNKEMCKAVNTGADANKLYGIGVKHGIVEKPEDRTAWVEDCRDSSGEIGQACVHVGDWSFTTDNYGGISGSDVAKAMKGKNTGWPRRIGAWAYSGIDFPGLSQCAPNGSEWNTKRGKSTSSKRKN